ncbi:PREDICTED: uncharacterized protein LOC107072763 isoform X3 [Polistes dominula]|uniref:Uncharacterized protein LOC107072763 isoform X3 n=1 Tax=Polistes dominula TaxID=743375 RepID=A0ABM1J7J7_POLDO|nr:PREDICTED: uncharacterized protein LOC107072763 isoform X3 [Polistes dominula]
MRITNLIYDDLFSRDNLGRHFIRTNLCQKRGGSLFVLLVARTCDNEGLAKNIILSTTVLHFGMETAQTRALLCRGERERENTETIIFKIFINDSFYKSGLLAVLSFLHIASSVLDRRLASQSNSGTDSVGESLLNARAENYDRFEEVLISEVLDDGVSGPTVRIGDSDGEI